MKKIDFVIFDPKKSWSRLGLGWISGTPVKIVKKWLDYLVLGMFFDKVKKFCDHSMILWEMAGVLLTNGLNQTSPHILGLSRGLIGWPHKTPTKHTILRTIVGCENWESPGSNLNVICISNCSYWCRAVGTHPDFVR